ncbi:hypothetical protein MUN76_13635 [Leucobacter rhizosphaerae]|uniref:Acetyltransferase n=1 Tax=Leucobacter rhizosphaerae TaxID=2932245 RepID=A0ABY4FUT1_9MICO|nr:hypothetical protein [Leucobacter rhizosphaerae]UOQ60066.1 hypothetical protein MUN76_13635 [Leucobacter rhizosphaerae]
MIFSSSGRPPRRMLCYGASGTGSQIALDLRYQGGSEIAFLGYVDDVQDPRRTIEPEFPIYSFEELRELDDVGVFVSVHDPAGRARVCERLKAHGIPLLGARGVPHLAHPNAEVGEGSVVGSTTRLGLSTRLGLGVLALGDLVAHDVEVGDFATLAIGSVVLGHVRIGAGAFIGARAVIGNGSLDRPVLIGDGARVGPGAVVHGNVPPGETVIGPQAMPISRWRSLFARPSGNA